MTQPHEDKVHYLRQQRTLNPNAEAVQDGLFQESEFFDPRDLLLVKYEMLRRVEVEGWAACRAAATFGFSRAGFYKALDAWRRGGLAGLIPARPGPRGAHKLTDETIAFIKQQLAENPRLRSAELAGLLLDRLNRVVHPRSIERALRREKKGRV